MSALSTWALFLATWTLAAYLHATRPSRRELRAIIRAEIDADRVMRSGFTGSAAESYAAALKADRARWLNSSNPSEAPRA